MWWLPGAGKNRKFRGISQTVQSFSYARGVSRGDLPYTIVIIGSSTVLYTGKFAERVGLILSVLITHTGNTNEEDERKFR